MPYTQILIIVARIESLPVTSPIARFSTGLQLLQRKIGEWNSVAHKDNNLLDIEIKCASYIQSWTKLELQCWRECLTHCQEKVQSQAYKFFFFFYNLVHEYLEEKGDVNGEGDGAATTTTQPVRANFNFKDYKSIEKQIREGAAIDEEPAEEEDDAVQMNLHDILRLLNDFVENSSYGEFHLRLNLLKTFALYTSCLETSPQRSVEKKRVQLVAVLYNVHAYFNQFATVVDEHVKTVRAPIEKKLKEFVKIESYNKDLSYVGIRSNIVKIQKNVHKFFKEFEAQLKMKITPAMDYKSRIADEHSAIKDQASDKKGKARPRYYICDAKLFLVAKLAAGGEGISEVTALDEGHLLPKISHFFTTSRNVVRQIINHCPVANRVLRLDDLLLEEVENCEYLRRLEVDRSQERPKQKSQAKQILNQKRKALADFYKTLTGMGVNHRTGLMEYNLRDSIMDFQVAPFCPRTQIYQEKTKRTDHSLVALCDKMDLYYAKAVFKVKTLLSVLVKPDTDLGVQNVERIKGFSIDLFMLIQYQRKHFSKSTRELQKLRDTIEDLAALNECSTVATDQNFICNRRKLIAYKSIALDTASYCDQFSQLLRTAPTELDTARYGTTVSQRFDLSSNSALFKEASRLLSRIQSMAQSISGDLIGIDEKSRFISNAVVDRNQSLSEGISMDLRNLRDLFKASYGGRTEHHAYYLAIDKFIGNVTDTLNGHALSTVDGGQNESRFLDSDFSNQLENTVHSILISLQKLYKTYKTVTESVPEKEAETKDDDTQLLDSHLRENICQELINSFELLNLRTILKQMDVAVNDVYESGCSESTMTKVRKLLSVAPLLEQFGFLVEFFLIQEAGAHSVSVKLLNVMLNVFIELVNNGFCVPKDLLSDEEPEKEKDQNGERSGEGMGLEDGTGEKDVSDKIENEDQLQDAKRPEEYEKDKGDEQQNKEEKGIDMSEDFDANLQDIEKKPDDEENSDSEKEDEEEDPDKQMGETEEGAEKLDDQIWGDEDKGELIDFTAIYWLTYINFAQCFPRQIPTRRRKMPRMT